MVFDSHRKDCKDLFLYQCIG